MGYKWKKDCRSFSGNYACDTLKFENYKDCEECKFYDPVDKKILIIKLGARGDVLRTTTILKAIKKKYQNASITWVVDENSKELLEGNNLIDKILVYNLDTVLRLKYEKFDILFSLEVNIPGIALANIVRAKRKYGYYLNKNGLPQPFRKSGDYYLERVFSDYVNKTNIKTYQEMIFGICELPYNKEGYMLNLSRKSKQYAEKFSFKNGKKLVGINVGSGGRFPSRIITKERIIELIKKLSEDYNIILLGGPNEAKLKKEIISKVKQKIYENDSENSIEEFIGIISLCDLIITGDTMTMHLAIGLGKKVIALFFCTPSSEIEDYDIVTKLVSPLLEKYFYTDEYSLELVNSISVDEIIEAVNI